MFFLDYLKREGFDFRKDKLEWLPNGREMSATASSGLVVDGNLETEVKGLFGAGDEVGGVPWSGAPGALAMGGRAGETAAKQAMAQKNQPEIDISQVDALQERCTAMLENTDGQSWREIEQATHNILDHYAGEVRGEGLLKRGQERIKWVRDNASFMAANPHELLRCLEVQSVMDISDMVLAASAERKETRLGPFGFRRGDYPEQDDANWFAFLETRRDGEGFEFSKRTINT